MTRRRRASARSRFVLLVGGDDATAEACARASAPLPVLRAKHMGLAAERLREIRPLVVLVAADVDERTALEVGRAADARAARLIRLSHAGDVWDDLRVRLGRLG